MLNLDRKRLRPSAFLIIAIYIAPSFQNQEGYKYAPETS